MNDKTLQLSEKRLTFKLLFLFFVLENKSFEDERRKKNTRNMRMRTNSMRILFVV